MRDVQQNPKFACGNIPSTTPPVIRLTHDYLHGSFRRGTEKGYGLDFRYVCRCRSNFHRAGYVCGVVQGADDGVACCGVGDCRTRRRVLVAAVFAKVIRGPMPGEAPFRVRIRYT